MKYSPGISNFLEEISSLSHSIGFLYFFALITEEGFLISPCYSLRLCIKMGISFLFPFAFLFPLFTAICKASSDSHFAFSHFCSMGMLLVPVSCTTSFHSSSGTLSFLTASLRCSSYTIKPIHLKGTVQWLLVWYSQSCLEHFSSPSKENLNPLSLHSSICIPLFHSPRHLLIYFLFL